MAIDDGVADHRDERRGDFWGDFAERGEDVGEFDFVCECTGVGGLDHGAVGDGIAVGDADFAEMRAAGDELFDHGGGEFQIGIAGGDERHQGLAFFAAELREEGINNRH